MMQVFVRFRNVELHNLVSEGCGAVDSIQDTSEDELQLVLVLELLDGGEMLEHIRELKKYSEKIAAHLFKQQLAAIATLHKR